MLHRPLLVAVLVGHGMQCLVLKFGSDLQSVPAGALGSILAERLLVLSGRFCPCRPRSGRAFSHCFARLPCLFAFVVAVGIWLALCASFVITYMAG